jgi:hypothetical protein
MRRHGSWWQENPDGTWLRWDSTSGVWVKQDSPPPPPPQENKPFDLPPPVEWFVDKSTAILAILALIIYGVVRVATDQFYTNLDVTPEEVGLNHTLIIGRAALYCVVIVASILIVEAAWISRTVPLLARFPRLSKISSRIMLSAVLFLLVIPPFFFAEDFLGIGSWLEELLSNFGAYSYLPAIFVLLFVWAIVLILLIRQNRLHEKRHAEGHPLSRVEDVTLLVLSIIHLLVLLALALSLFRWDFPRILWQETGDFGRTVLLVNWAVLLLFFLYWSRRTATTTEQAQLSAAETASLIAVLALLAVSALSLSGSYGFYLADNLDDRRHRSGWGFELLSIRAYPVCVSWLESKSPEVLKRQEQRSFLYLGQADQTLVLYDTNGGNPVRLPTGKASITMADDTRAAEAGCPAPQQDDTKPAKTTSEVIPQACVAALKEASTMLARAAQALTNWRAHAKALTDYREGTISLAEARRRWDKTTKMGLTEADRFDRQAETYNKAAATCK